MKQERVEARLRDILETDWREEAEQVLDERRRSGSGEVSVQSPPHLSFY